MRLTRMLTVIALTVVISPLSKAQLGGGVVVCANCASEPTAASIKIMQDLEYAKQILQYAVQVQQLADMVRNTTHGGPMTLNNVAWI